MSIPILPTKLYVPSSRPRAVPRPRLLARLDEGLAAGHKLTLISAPAGFGKTTLVSTWLHQSPIQNPKSKIQNGAAWLSLDAEDNDLTRFLTYLVAALQSLVPGVGAGVLAALQSPQPLPAETLLTALISDIAAVLDRRAAPPGTGLILVLDDYHVLDARPIDRALAFLIEHLPPQMHLVITTREDPPLPLARLRARGQLTELRAADLRFTAEEAAEFLNRTIGLGLSTDDVTALEARTEGWIAGLQLAALSLSGRPDPASFIASFSGTHHFMMDYLLEEVLQRQTYRSNFR